jgi:hypothetical protein
MIKVMRETFLTAEYLVSCVQDAHPNFVYKKLKLISFTS